MSSVTSRFFLDIFFYRNVIWLQSVWVWLCIELQNWEVNFQQDTPVAPRFDVNAPDLYIPVMAFITYVLVAGLALGTQNR